MEPRRSLGWPILLGVVLIGSLVALTVGWVLVSIAAALGSGNAAFYWAVLGVGVALLVVVLAGVIVYLALTVKAIALSQRQSNFIDSVTHELKSPLASLKLYLQTLTRRSVPAEQQADFHRFMLQDVERLDGLPRHVAVHPCGVLLSDATLLDRTPVEASYAGFPMSQFDKDDVEDLGLLKLDVLGIRMQSSMAHAVAEIRRVDGVEVDLEHRRGVPPVVNTEDQVTLIESAVRGELGENSVQLTPQSMGGEDFAWYLTHCPGALVRLGTRTPGGITYDIHQGDLLVDERAVEIAALVTAVVAVGATLLARAVRDRQPVGGSDQGVRP